MRRVSKKPLNQQSKSFLFFFLVLFTLLINSLNTDAIFFPTSILSSNTSRLLEEELTPQAVHKSSPVLKINSLANTGEPIQYFVEQSAQFDLKTSHIKQMDTTSFTNVSIESKVLNSSFQILSNAENNSNEWENDIEPGYGTVNVTSIFWGDTKVFRLNFSENNQTPLSGITNTKYMLQSNPDVTRFPTMVSFDFRIPFLTPQLLSSPHTLALEFRFNNSSITFILSDFGSNLGEFLEDNVTRPIGSDSLYILCNESAPFGWRHITHNITRLITTYFSQEEFSKFSSFETLFCYMISFTPGYYLALDIDNLEYFTFLPPSVPINYSIGEIIISNNNGSLDFSSTIGNFTFAAYEDSPWVNNSQTFLEVNVTRKTSYEGFLLVKEWNESLIRIMSNLTIPDIIEDPSTSFIYIMLPSDWINFSVIDHNIIFEFENQTEMLNEYILGRLYRINVHGIDEGILEAWVPNYFSNITTPTDVTINEVVQIRGNLRYPLPGDINLYLYNNSFFFHKTTLPMINSTFIFPGISINDQFSSGFFQLTLNWSNLWEFGMFEKLLYVHEKALNQSNILFHSLQNVDTYRYQSLHFNLSLSQDGNRYCTNSTMVFLIKGSESFFFSQTAQKNFIFNVSHILWDPGNYSLDVIASDGSIFFARDVINISIEPASIYWSFENLYTQLSRDENVNFRLHSYTYPQSGGFFQPLSGLGIRVWVNDTVISNYETNLAGFVEINFSFNCSEDYLQVAIGALLGGRILKFQTILFIISNETTSYSRTRAYIFEIMRSPIKANETYFVYYNIEYPNNKSNWYVPIHSFSDFILSAFILRGNYVIETQIENQMLSWTIDGNKSINDILVLELPGPTVLVIKEDVSKKFRIKLEAYSDITTNNYTIEIDLTFLCLPFSNLSLLDSLNRDITSYFIIDIKGSIFSVSLLSIISGIQISYYLEGYLQELEIQNHKPFSFSYIYNESIIGSWRINTANNLSFYVQYNKSGFEPLKCENTVLKVITNTSSEITATLNPQRWNTTISIQLVINHFSELLIASSIQNFSIIDPYPPTLDYFIEQFPDVIRVHAFTHEPEQASGVKNVLLLFEDQNFTANSFSSDHYMFDITKDIKNNQKIKLVVVDWAGNERSSELINIDLFISSDQSLLELLESNFFFPAIFSSLIIGGIFITRIIKKKNTSIL